MEPENRGLDLEKELTCSVSEAYIPSAEAKRQTACTTVAGCAGCVGLVFSFYQYANSWCLQICTEVLYQPLTLLDCLHTFCGSCLKEWFSFQLTSFRNSPNSAPAGSTPYTCPSCREPVRDTKHNSGVHTLLDMFMIANPDKSRTPDEKEDIVRKYTPGENVLPKVAEREKTLRERRVEDEDRRLMAEARNMSLREAGVESSEARRERRRREEDGRSHGGSRSQSSRDNSRDSRSTGDRERRRRREAEAAERRRVRDESSLRPEGVPTEDRRRRHSDEEASRRRIEVTSQTAARQVEHQSSLRSLISSSDVDSREMEEEILRQIREEGLLDGIDLENIDVSQEDQISERIAEAFRRRQNERRRDEPARRSDASRRSDAGARRRPAQHSAPASREASGDETSRTSITTRRHRTHSRSSSAVSHGEEQSRPPPSMSAVQSALLDVHSGSESSRRRRRTTSSSRSATTPIPIAEPEARPAARSQTDLSNRPQSYHVPVSRPLVTANSRSSTDPIAPQVFELPTPGQLIISSPSPQELPSPDTIIVPEQSSSKSRPKTRATPPAEIFVPLHTSSTMPQPSTERSLMPAPLSPRGHDPSKGLSLSDRANAMSSASRPTSSSSPTGRSHQKLYPEPSLTCAQCGKLHIEYELHYDCLICHGGEYSICLSCYRSGRGCLHWFGFGQAAWTKWEWQSQSSPGLEKPHMLHPSRYIAPRIPEGGADGRRTLTTEDPQKRFQSGVFCSNCLAWANECYWQCTSCNENDWGFCNSCVNQGKSCTHPLLPMTYIRPETSNPPVSPTQGHQMPPSARILTGPGITSLGNFKFLTFSTTCDICHHIIQPSTTRYHCFYCISKDPRNQGPGDYDICTTCYPKLVASRRISTENGPNGWRRCLQGHRMIVCGFDESRSGQRRIIVQDLVGGLDLRQEPSSVQDHTGGELRQWSWGDGAHVQLDGIHKKLVTTDVMKSSPVPSPDSVYERGFPPDGGVGMKALATWSWYPQEGAEDELMFPKGAELRECKDVNEDWFHGTYMGKSGLFPSPYVKILDRVIGP
jgi:hypothetical protein